MPERPRKQQKPSRPFIADTATTQKSARDKTMLGIELVVLALLAGFVVGFAVYAVMNLSTWLTELIWNGLGGALNFTLFPLVVCTLGGVIIGVWTWWSNDRVKSLEEVMAEFKQTGNYKTNGAVKPVVTFLLPLMFGGSIGFEAGLTGLITAGCCWIRDRLKAAGLRAAAVTDVAISASFAAIFRTPIAGVVAGAETDPAEPTPNVDEYEMRKSTKMLLYTAAAFGAFGGIRLFSGIFSVSGGLPRFGEIGASGVGFLWAIPCLLLAYVMTLVFHGSKRLFGSISSRIDGPEATIGKPIVTGVVMGAVACVLPLVLFPGETQSEELVETWTTMSAFVLIATGVLKAAITPMCINMGWVGGDFFPSIFAGVSAGFGLAALTGADPMLMVTVTATAFLAGVLRKPLIVLGILFLCFPLDSLFWMGTAAVIGASLPIPGVLKSKE